MLHATYVYVTHNLIWYIICKKCGEIYGLGRSSGVGNGNSLQYSCLENSMDRRFWQATVHRITKRRTLLNTSVQFSSVTQSCPTLCDLMNCSTPGLPVYHQLQEFTQTHAHRVGDAIQTSHPLSSPTPPALNLSQHQGIFKWVSSLHQVAKVLEFQLQHQFSQWTPKTDLLQDGLVGSPCSLRDSQESSPTPQFKNINSSVLSFPYSPTLTSIHDCWKNHSLDKTDLFWQSNLSAF